MRCRSALSSLVTCLFLALNGAALPQELAASHRDKVHPHLRRLLAEHAPVTKAWVFFADKRVGPAEAREARTRARAELAPRALERRRARRTAPGLVDERDFPVAPTYVERVLASGVELVVTSKWLNAVSVRGTLAQFEALATLPFVERLEPVRRGRLLDGLTVMPPGPLPPASQSVALGGFYGVSEAQLDQIGIVDLHTRGYTGTGILIGVLDTGFHRGHEAFNQTGHVVNVVAEHDFVDGDSDTGIEAGDPSGQHQHGTYILGTLAAYLPTELVGGAPDASFVLCKTEDVSDEYQQEEDFYAAGLEFIETHGGDLATSSLGYIDWYTQSDLDGLTAVTTLAVNAATDNGMVCVTAAGNAGHDADPGTSALIAPADALEVLTTGAVDVDGVIAGFSSDGPSADGRVKPELVACGVATATVCAFTDVDCTTAVNGTSLSTPLLAALVACLLEAHPDFTVSQLRARLFRTGDYFVANGTFDPDHVRGYGIPDGDAAGFDCNANGVDDEQDLVLGTSQDCNGNGLPDSCDLADGVSLDTNGNGRPDECEHRGLRSAPPPSGSAVTSVPLVVAPPRPKLGGLLRLAPGVPSGTVLVVLFRSDGASFVQVLSASAAGVLAIPLPDDPSLLGRALYVRAGYRDEHANHVRWSEELELVLTR